MRKKLGTVGVDSGSIWIGDPCYIMGEDSTSGVKSWSEFTDRVFTIADRHGGYNKASNTMAFEPLGSDVGLDIGTLYGDGTYPVYGEFDDKGRITSVTIDFDPSGDEEE